MVRTGGGWMILISWVPCARHIYSPPPGPPCHACGFVSVFAQQDQAASLYSWGYPEEIKINFSKKFAVLNQLLAK